MRARFRGLGGALLLAAWCVVGCGGTAQQSNGTGGTAAAQGGGSVVGTGGTPSGGTPSGGTPSGGAPSGGAPSGGAPSGGAPSGGAPSGGAPSGGAPSGDVPGAPLPLDHTAVASCQQSASTNSASVTVTIFGDGSADRVNGPMRGVPVPAPMSYPPGSPDVLTFLADVRAVGDVTQIPIADCAKSVSFGTETTVTAYGKTSVDLQCAGMTTPAQAALITDCYTLLGSSG